MKKNLLLNSALTLLAVMITLQVCAQQRFDQRRIYQIVSVLHPDKVLGFDGTGGSAESGLATLRPYRQKCSNSSQRSTGKR